MAEAIALTHHERWDGSGYPAGLAADNIPFVGRIVAIADAFDAMTHSRPYQAAIAIADALDTLADLRGRAYDPTVVDAITGLHRDGTLKILG
jgi:putative two-component system response regulator